MSTPAGLSSVSLDASHRSGGPSPAPVSIVVGFDSFGKLRLRGRRPKVGGFEFGKLH